MRRRIGHTNIPYRMPIAMGLSDTVRELLLTGMTQEELAGRLNVKQPQVSRWLTGAEPRGDTRDRIIALAQSKGIRPSIGGQGKEREVPIAPANLRRLPPNIATPQDGKIPVMGTSEGGEEGWSLFNGDVLDYVNRPPFVSAATGAYAVYVVGSSMEPRYYPGELLYIHPGRPVTVGSFVVVQAKPRAEGEPPRALIARLERKTPTKYVFAKLNPPRQIEVPIREVVSVHKIVGSGE